MRIQRDGKPWWNFPAWKSGMKENREGMWIALSECPGTGYTLSQSQYSRWPGCVLCAVYLDWSVVVVVWWLDALTDWLVSLPPSLCTQCHSTAALQPLAPDSGQPSDARPGPSEKASSWATATTRISKAPGLSLIIISLLTSGYKSHQIKPPKSRLRKRILTPTRIQTDHIDILSHLIYSLFWCGLNWLNYFFLVF